MILDTANRLRAACRVGLPLVVILTLSICGARAANGSTSQPGSSSSQRAKAGDRDSVAVRIIRLSAEVEALKEELLQLQDSIKKQARAAGDSASARVGAIRETRGVWIDDKTPLYISIAACIIAFGIGISTIYDRKKLTKRLETQWKDKVGEDKMEEMRLSLQQSLGEVARRESAERLPERVGKLEKQLLALQSYHDQSKPASEPAAHGDQASTVLYLSKKIGNAFARAYDTPRLDCAWELFDIQGNRASFRAYGQGIIEAQARNTLRTLIDGVCSMNGNDRQPIRTVTTDKPGTMRREGDAWVVETAAVITIGG